MPELEPTVGRYVAEGVIPGVARPGDTIIVDPIDGASSSPTM